MAVTFNDIPYLRLARQQVQEPTISDPEKLVAWMGAMQAQDFPMAKWAIGIRTGVTNQNAIINAIDKGHIIRTHVLRPTWHFVAAKDAQWMLDLTAPYIKRSLVSRHRELEITTALLKKSYRVMEKVLSGGVQLTREALVGKLTAAKIATHDQRAVHILLHAELDRLICSGALQGNKNTYALVAERIQNPLSLDHEQALATLAARYFTSHGPATAQDFTWWSGLPATEARKGIESIKGNFRSEKIEGQTYWFHSGKNIGRERPDTVHLLPAFDEFIISYKDRTACLPLINHKTTISMNGFFRPVVVINGKVTGVWKRSVAKKKVVLEMEFFPKEKAHKKKELKELIAAAGQKVRAFFGDEVASASSATGA